MRWAGREVEGCRRAGPGLSERGVRQGCCSEAAASLGRAAGAAAAGSRRAALLARSRARRAVRCREGCYPLRPSLCTPAQKALSYSQRNADFCRQVSVHLHGISRATSFLYDLVRTEE